LHGVSSLIEYSAYSIGNPVANGARFAQRQECHPAREKTSDEWTVRSGQVLGYNGSAEFPLGRFLEDVGLAVKTAPGSQPAGRQIFRYAITA
jgi:hypothetical protein